MALFHVRMDVNIPTDLDPATKEETVAREKAYSQKLQREGKWRHLWRIAGRYANVSVAPFDGLVRDFVRAQGARRLQVLEVFHMCLLLGFQGKYLLEGSEKLGYYTARLGDEIAHLKGKRAPFAPHWAAPDKVMHTLRHEVPLWAVASVVALFGLAAFIGLRWQLGRTTQGDLSAYQDVVKLPPRAAHLTITLP